MRINSLHAIAFSYMVDQRLELADGMTIAIGENETGKSAWHAAIYAALCGRRRGTPRTFDRTFKERHAPWDRDEWEVECTVTLQDGAELEIRHELEGHLNCHIVNRVTGEDLSQDHMNDQCPDGARLLGLSRDIMWATLFVRQANIIQDLNSASGLREALQRAADAGEERATATRAIETLDQYLRNEIGTIRAPTKALMTSHREVEAARAALDDAIEKKEGLADLHATLSQLNHEVDDDESAFRDLESWAVYLRLTELQERTDRIRALSEGFPRMTPPPPSDDIDHTIDLVEGALAGWRGLPEAHELPRGPSASALTDQIDALPPQPDGDTEPAQEVVHAHTNLRELTAIAEASIRGPEIDLPEGVEEATSPSELRSLAADLELATDPEPTQPRKWPMWAVGAGVVLLITSVAMLASEVTALGLASLVVGFLMTVGGGIPLLLGRLAQPATTVSRADEARRRVDDLRITAGSAGLRQLAADLERKLGSHEREDRISQEEKLNLARAQLTRLLEEHGVDVGSAEKLPDAFLRYRQECNDRDKQATEADRKPDLENQLRARQQLEEQFAETEKLRSDAVAQLEEVASMLEIERISSTAVFADEITERLKNLRSARSQSAERTANWLELESLLDDREPGDWEGDRDVAAQRLETLGGKPDGESPEDIEPKRTAAQNHLADERERRDRLDERVGVKEADIPSIPSLEESLAGCEDRLARLEYQKRIVEAAMGFMDEAQTEIYKTIAPKLKDSVEARIEKITNGRYTHVTVDPEDLQVQVKTAGGSWQLAENLSHGTSEQIYLVLRMAIAEQLTEGNESGFLVLDDVTVQSDDPRTIEFLEILHGLSEDRQVILFTQETVVADWARAKLIGPRDSVIELDKIAS